ncbi:MAG: type II toxin-antitoxin system HicA family toxin [Nitrospirae bacterium]|nr:type II toxin-antitoxin system HicA family toxin [Nitrospirota bacterium]
MSSYLSYTSGPGPLQLGYSVTRQTGSHLRLMTSEHGEHHLTIPLHSPLRIGTLSAIL